MVDGKTRPRIAFSGPVSGAESLSVVVVREHQDLDMIGDDQLIEPARAKGCPAWNVAQQSEGAGIFEAFGNPEYPSGISALPGAMPRRAQHRLVRIVSLSWVEEYPLDRRQLPSFANCDQQSGQELGVRLWQIGTARMKADVRRNRREVTSRKMVLGERVANVHRLVPDANGVAGACSVCCFRWCSVLGDAHSGQFSKDVLTGAAGEAGDQYASIALAKG